MVKTVLPVLFLTWSLVGYAAQPVDLDQHLDQALKNGSASHVLNDSWPGLTAANQALARAGLKPDGVWRVDSVKNDAIGNTGCSFLTTSFSINTPTPKHPNQIWVYETRSPRCPKQGT